MPAARCELAPSPDRGGLCSVEDGRAAALALGRRPDESTPGHPAASACYGALQESPALSPKGEATEWLQLQCPRGVEYCRQWSRLRAPLPAWPIRPRWCTVPRQPPSRRAMQCLWGGAEWESGGWASPFQATTSPFQGAPREQCFRCQQVPPLVSLRQAPVHAYCKAPPRPRLRAPPTSQPLTKEEEVTTGEILTLEGEVMAQEATTGLSLTLQDPPAGSRTQEEAPLQSPPPSVETPGCQDTARAEETILRPGLLHHCLSPPEAPLAPVFHSSLEFLPAPPLTRDPTAPTMPPRAFQACPSPRSRGFVAKEQIALRQLDSEWVPE